MTTYRGVAASVAQDKASHPERFCPHDRCLWNTSSQGGGYCPRHADPSKPDDRPRATYLLPGGRTVEKVFPSGTTPPDVSTYTYLAGKGRTVTVTRVENVEVADVKTKTGEPSRVGEAGASAPMSSALPAGDSVSRDAMSMEGGASCSWAELDRLANAAGEMARADRAEKGAV